MIKCQICNKQFKENRFLAHHLISHKISIKDYYTKYISSDNKCPICNKLKPFFNITVGYRKTCGNIDCQNEYTKIVWKNKYGVDNPSKSKEIHLKKEQTKLEHFGNKNYNNMEKNKQTKLKHFENKNYNNRKKAIETMLNRYNVENPNHIKEIRNKIEQTNLKKYGKNTYAETDNFKKNLKKMMIEKYGVDHYTKTKEYKLLWENENFVNKCLTHRYETMKKNNTFHTSKPEDNLYIILKNNFENIERQYKSKLYPFSCDFYIPKLDLYIEYQGTWLHNKEPFNKNKIEHQQILNEWKEKSKTSDFYKTAIEVWTERDIHKRKFAKVNNLNYLEIFNYINEQDVLNQIKRIL